MGEQTEIAWTDHTFNPWIGCTKVSAGCANCYAEALDHRWGHDSWGAGKPRRLTSASNWKAPLLWNKRAKAEGVQRRVFCASLADVFDAEAPAGALANLWDLISRTPNLDWLLLTKRPERITESLPEDWGSGWNNVWLGTSVENQDAARRRIPQLMAVRHIGVKFLSAEPLLGPVDLSGPWCDEDGEEYPLGVSIHWCIVGGESGPGHRPMDPAWARKLREDCRDQGVAFFFKQTGGLRPGTGDLDGEVIREFPARLVR